MNNLRSYVKQLPLGSYVFQRFSNAAHRLFTRGPVPIESDFPWTSPSIWTEVTGHYKSIPSPSIFEYGLGVSSIWHLRQLMKLGGGQYSGVEHNRSWWDNVIESICREWKISRNQWQIVPVDSHSTEFLVATLVHHGIQVRLNYCFLDSAISSPEMSKVSAYVASLSETQDVVIIDGKARLDCGFHVLDSSLIRPGGLLALYEAGRGTDGWLGYPKLTGQSDYSALVNRMKSMGGETVDGDGIDSWDELNGRRGLGPQYRSYPLEACILRF